MNIWLPPSRAFMDNIILIPSKIAADGLLQRYYDLFTWARMKAKPKKSRSLSLVKEIRIFGEQRTASAVTLAKKCAWTKWNDTKPIKLSWKSLIPMEPLAISFLLHSTYDLLSNVTNLKLWGYTDSDMCLSCKSDRGTLRHELSSCPLSLQIYTSRHNKVLEVVIELLRAQCETANQQPVTAKEPIIQFLKEGECPVRKQKIPIWSY